MSRISYQGICVTLKVIATPRSGGISGTLSSLDRYDICTFQDKVRISDSNKIDVFVLCAKHEAK